MKIYVIGDSISIHYGPFLECALEGVMSYARKEGEAEALLNLDRPQGANGGDSSLVLSFLQGMAKRGGLNADLLLVNCGLHDIKTDIKNGTLAVPLEKYKENLKGIITVAKEMGVQLVWIRTTPCDEAIHNTPEMVIHRFSADGVAYNAAADEVMGAAGIPSIDLYTFTKNLGSGTYCDHVHFHESVRQRQAAFIAGWLNAWIQNARVDPAVARMQKTGE